MRYKLVRFLQLSVVPLFILMMVGIAFLAISKGIEETQASRQFIRDHTVAKIGEYSLVQFPGAKGTTCTALVRPLSKIDPRAVRCE